MLTHRACIRAASSLSSCTRICSSIFWKISGGSCRFRVNSRYCRRLLKNSLNFRDQYALKSALLGLARSSLFDGLSSFAAATRNRCLLACLHLLGLCSTASCGCCDDKHLLYCCGLCCPRCDRMGACMPGSATRAVCPFTSAAALLLQLLLLLSLSSLLPVLS